MIGIHKFFDPPLVPRIILGGLLPRLTVMAVITAVLSVIIAYPGNAQINEDDYTGAERIGFAFYKIGGIEPDFDSWITGTEAYINSMPGERRTMLENENNRLRLGFANFDPDYDFISLDTAVTISKAPRPIARNTNIKLDMPYPFNHYFPIKVGDIWVALVVREFNELREIELSDAEFRNMNQYVDFDRKGRGQGHIRFVLKAVAVDTSQPLDIDGLTVWPMLVKVASMSVWSEKKGQFIWAYDAPGYNSRGQQRLYNLQYE